MAGYNRTRYVEQLLEKTEPLPPSFTVHLHPEYWVLNNGSKFLYHNQIASLLDDIRAQRIPVDFLELFDSARVPFYDGCMVVELLDYRPQRSREPALKVPEKTRVVLHPNSETLWADICLMNRQNGAQWTDKDALEVEAKILLATSQPLCLDPDPHLTRIVNSVLRMSTPTMPPSLKRKAAAMEPEEDGPEKARRSRILSFMAPQNNKSHMPSYRILEALNAFRNRVVESGPGKASMAGHQYMNGIPRPPQSAPQPQPQSSTASTPTPVSVSAQGASPMDPPPNPPQMQPQMQQHYIQQQYQQQQQQSHPQNQPRPPSQPQQPHPQQLPPTQHQQPQQRFTQSPKLPAQPNVTTPALTQPTPQPFPSVQPAFQPPIPHSHILQQPLPGGRNGPAHQPTNQQQHQQALYAQQLQHQQLLSQQQLQQNANSILVHQQQMAMAANGRRNSVGGRATPQGVPAQVSAQQLQHLQQPLRRQTPQQQLQGQLAVARATSQSQSPHTPKAQVRQQTPQLPNRTPQLQQRTPQQLQQIQNQQIQNQQSSPQTQAQAQVQTQPQSQTQPQTQPQSQPQPQPQQQQQQMSAHPHYPQVYGYPPQMNYQIPSAFWQRGMQGMMPASATTPQQQQLLLMQQAQQQQQQQQAQQSQQAQSQLQVQPQPVSVVGGQPIMMGSGKGKAGQKKTLPKRGGAAGR